MNTKLTLPSGITQGNCFNNGLSLSDFNRLCILIARNFEEKVTLIEVRDSYATFHYKVSKFILKISMSNKSYNKQFNIFSSDDFRIISFYDHEKQIFINLEFIREFIESLKKDILIIDEKILNYEYNKNDLIVQKLIENFNDEDKHNVACWKPKNIGTLIFNWWT